MGKKKKPGAVKPGANTTDAVGRSGGGSYMDSKMEYFKGKGLKGC
jgi:hypothetical protein